MIKPLPMLAMLLFLEALGACGRDDSITSPIETPAATTVKPELALAPNSWTLRAPMIVAAFSGVGAEAINNSAGEPVVYVLGGGLDNNRSLNVQVLAYNTVSNVWKARSFCCDGVIFRERPNGVGRIGGLLYITGGFNWTTEWGTNSKGLALAGGTLAYRPSTNSLTNVAAIPRASANGVTGVINGKMYVLIGTAKLSETACDFDSCPLGTFRILYRYNPVSNSWVTLKSAPHFHRNGAGGVINGKFYVVGGFDSKGNATRNLDVYNPANNSWTTLALLPKLLTGLKASVLQGKLYVASTTATYAYNPATNAWAQKAAPPTNSTGRAVGAAAVTVTLSGKQRMVVVGGPENSAGVPRTSIYTP